MMIDVVMAVSLLEVLDSK